MIIETVRSVLEALDEQGRSDHADWEERVRESLTALEGDYKKLTESGRAPIDYSELSTQAAYVYRYVYGHAEFIYDFLKAARIQTGTPLFTDTVLTIASVGGGPGSELLGLLKYLEEGHDEPDITRIIYTIFDKETNWQHVAELVVGAIDSEIEVEFLFETVDVSASPMPPKASLHEEDAVFMSFFISEVCALSGQKTVTTNLQKLLKSMPKGSKLFYKDSSAFSFYSFMNSQVRAAGVLKEIIDINGKYTADTPEMDGIFSDYINEYGYGQKLNGSAVSKILERI